MMFRMGFAVLGLVIAGLAVADGGETGIQKLRHNYMEAIGGHMGSIGTIMKEGMANPDMILGHAKGIEAVSGHLIELFPKDSGSGTDAKPEIWTKWDDFQSKAKALQDVSANLVKVAASKDMKTIGPAVGELGKTCKGCHQDYKKSDK